MKTESVIYQFENIEYFITSDISQITVEHEHKNQWIINLMNIFNDQFRSKCVSFTPTKIVYYNSFKEAEKNAHLIAIQKINNGDIDFYF